MWKKVKNYINSDGSFSCFTRDMFIFDSVSFMFLTIIYCIFRVILWLFLLVTAPIWVLPYLIFTKKL